MTDAIELYGNPRSASTYHVRLMLSLCNLEFKYITVNLPKGEHKTTEFLAMNPFGQIPVLKIGEQVISQSWLILERLAKLTKQFYSTESTKITQIKEWIYWNIDQLFIPLAYLTAFELNYFPTTDEVKKAYRQLALHGLEIFSGLISNSRFLVGDEPTIADIAVYSSIANADDAKIVLDKWPTIMNWKHVVESLPSFYPKGHFT